MLINPEEISTLSKEELKSFKNKFKITNPDIEEIKKELKLKLKDDQSELTDCVKIKKCGHAYHNDCLKKWFETNNTCPLCRLELKNE